MSKAKAKVAPKLSPEQRLLLEQLRPMLPRRGYDAIPEHPAIPGRKFRVDVAVVDLMAARDEWHPLAIEIDGGIWTGGRHSGGKGQLRDMEKLNLLTEHGWRCLKFTPAQVRDGSALEVIRRCL